MQKFIHRAKKSAKKSGNGSWRGFVAFVLCLVMLVTTFAGITLFSSVSAAEQSRVTNGTVKRESDPSTMDSYLEMLDFTKDTRNAGRLWTDKSVFANGQLVNQLYGSFARKFSDNALTLIPGLDGADGSVPLNSDFLEVFSALGSSELVNENIPIDMMFLLDVSGSMGAENRRGNSNNTPGTEDQFDNGELPINKTVKALNAAIETLLKANPNSRFGITIYGSTAAVLVPLGHYTKNGNDDFLKAEWIDTYGTQGLHFSITATVKTVNGDGTDEVKTYKGSNDGESNNQAHNANSGTGNPERQGTGGATEGDGTEQNQFRVGHITNPQAGLAAAMDQFITGNEETTFTSDSGKKYSRIPALLHITDGQATDIAWVQSQADQNSANPWKKEVSAWNNVNWNYDLAYNSKQAADASKYNVSQLGGSGAATPVIFQTLMTAAYYKAAVNAHYNAAKAEDSAGGDIDLQCYSVYASDNHPYSEPMPDNLIQATIDAILDPEKKFKDSPDSNIADSSGLNKNNDSAEKFIDTAYELYKKLIEDGNIDSTFGPDMSSSTSAPEIEHFTLAISKDDAAAGAYESLGLTWADVDKNINYVQNGHFQSDNFDNISGLINNVIQQLQGSLFSPVIGQNDLGVSDSVTFMDPVGKYMEVKDVTKLLLFGRLYSIVKTGVYDYPFVSAHRTAPGTEGTFTTGWYHITADGEWLGDVEHKGNLTAGLEDTDCFRDSGSPPTEQWVKLSDGGCWKYYLNSGDARQYISTLPSEDSLAALQANDPAQYRKFTHTDYTFYRVDLPEGERKAYRVNPAFPQPDGAATAQTPGAYTLNDLRIWVEDTGDYNDSVIAAGGLESDTGFDRALWINIPVNMIPLRTVTLSQDNSGNWTYKTNIPIDPGTGVTENSPESASFPLRVFYEIGVEEEVLTSARRVNTADISAEYIANNRIKNDIWAEARGLEGQTGSIEFFSNWYNPENRYGDYITSNTEYSYGDPAATFAPSGDNKYYVFENSLPLYKAAYRYNGNEWQKVDTAADFSGADFDGKIIGLNLACEGNDAAIKAALGSAQNTAASGDIVLLAGDLLSNVDAGGNVDPFPSDGWYFLPIDCFALKEGGTAETLSYCVARMGSEFGSAYQASGIENGDMLCWYDVSGKYSQIYPYLSYTDTNDTTRGREYIGYDDIYDADGNLKPLPELQADSDARDRAEEIQRGGNWVVAARPGGLRVGNLAQAVRGKTRVYDAGGNGNDSPDMAYDDDEQGRAYINERFPGKDESFRVRYYKGNTTRTANNYYMPTISISSAVGEGDENSIVVNTYLGNNGRLAVIDTSVTVTKTVVPTPENMPFDKGKEFGFQVYIKGAEGDFDAIVVKLNGSTWSRQLNYADVTPDSKLFLLNTDGTNAMADSTGRRVVKAGIDESNKQKYAYADGGAPFTGQIYYIFAGSNTDEGTLRVYGNPDNPDNAGTVISGNITQQQENDDSAAYYIDNVWLCTPEQYESLQPGDDGSYMKPNGSPVDLADGNWISYAPQGGYKLLTLTHDDNADFSSSDVAVHSDYATASPYWTEKVHFGLGDGAEVYDPSLSSNRANIAEFTLTHGYGLLFAGFAPGTEYRVTEKIKPDDISGGYAFRSVTHVTGKNDAHTYTTEGGGTAQFGDGYYSVFGTTQSYEQSAHYVNTAAPDALRVSKTLAIETEGQTHTLKDLEREFNYTVTFSNDVWEEGTSLGDLPYWTGATAETGSAPRVTDEAAIENLDTLPADPAGTNSYKFTLKHGQSIVIYHLPVGTAYTVTETNDPDYPIDDETNLTKEGFIRKTIEPQTVVTDNSAEYTNIKPPFESGSLSVEKNVVDDNKGTADFTFTATLTVKSDDELNYQFTENLLSAKKFTAENPEPDGEALRLEWKADNSGERRVYTAEFTLKHGEKAAIYGVPYGSDFTVAETGRPGYNLQKVVDNTDPEKPVEYTAPDGDGVSGTVTESTPDVSFVFENGRAAFLPFTGHFGGVWFCIALGAALLVAAFVSVCFMRRKARRQ